MMMEKEKEKEHELEMVMEKVMEKKHALEMVMEKEHEQHVLEMVKDFELRVMEERGRGKRRREATFVGKTC